MKDVSLREFKTKDGRGIVGILTYTGTGDPVKHLKAAVARYVRNEPYNEFIDANMDNPWVRVIIKGVHEMDRKEFDPAEHHL